MRLFEAPARARFRSATAPSELSHGRCGGVRRWNEGDLVRVNAKVLQMEAAICLDFIWDEATTMERLVNLSVIREELDRQPVNLTNAELQDAMDQFRATPQPQVAEHRGYQLRL